MPSGEDGSNVAPECDVSDDSTCAEEFAHLDTLSPQGARELAGRLEERGVELSLSPRPLPGIETAPPRVPVRRGRVFAYVRRQDLETAQRLQSELIRESLPDLPDGFDPDRLAPEQCPACGSLLSDLGAECTECGLALPDPDRRPEPLELASPSWGGAVASMLMRLKRLFSSS